MLQNVTVCVAVRHGTCICIQSKSLVIIWSLFFFHTCLLWNNHNFYDVIWHLTSWWRCWATLYSVFLTSWSNLSLFTFDISVICVFQQWWNVTQVLAWSTDYVFLFNSTLCIYSIPSHTTADSFSFFSEYVFPPLWVQGKPCICVFTCLW